MDALTAVNGLGDPKISCQATKHIGVFSRNPGLRLQQNNHVAKRHLRTNVKVRVHTHSDEMRRCFSLRVNVLQIVAQDQLEGTSQSRFYRSDTNFAVALRTVTIST